MYNQYSYNDDTYNGPHTLHVVLLADSTALTESLSPKDLSKLLSDSLSMTEDTIFGAEKLLTDIIFLDEIFTKQITNKGLFDSIRLNDWISIKKLRSTKWSD